MTEDEARRLLLVRAVELQDAAGTTFTAEDRRQATAAGLTGMTAGRRPIRREVEDDAFLVTRSTFAFARITTRSPALARAGRDVRWPSSIGWGVPLAALAVGMATNEIDSGQRLNIIAFPLLGMLAWNLVVYVWLTAAWLGRLGRRSPEPPARGLPARVLVWVSDRMRRPPVDGSPVGLAVARFLRDWLSASAPLTQARASRTLHLTAAALAAGVLLGMYARALGLEYRAGWESTFVEAGVLHRVVEFVLGPAARLTGIALPDVARLEALRWGPGRTGENAGPWIHLYATTAAIFILGPRLLLATGQAVQAWQLGRRFPTPGREDFYVRRLLRDARDDGTVVRVIPYSFHLSGETEQQLRHLLTGVLGDRTRVTVDTPVVYGAEDEWLANVAIDPETDHVLALFNLSATPEAEIHGALIAGLQRRLLAARSGAALTAIVEESAYRLRLAGQAGSGQRLDARRLAWDAMLGHTGVTRLALDLSESDDVALARQVEGSLMRGPALTSRGTAA